jgi:hypothetical protein
LFIGSITVNELLSSFACEVDAICAEFRSAYSLFSLISGAVADAPMSPSEVVRAQEEKIGFAMSGALDVLQAAIDKVDTKVQDALAAVRGAK